MIDVNEIFSDSDKRIALWCDAGGDTNDLAMMCENIIENGVNLISVPPEIVYDVWVYLEKSEIFLRNFFGDSGINRYEKNIKK